jgi:predicted transcriptional regulator
MKKTHPVAIRMDPDVKAALEERARADERSLSWYVNRVLRQHVGLDKPPRAAKPAKAADRR